MNASTTTPDLLRTLPYRRVGTVDGLPLRWQDEQSGVLPAAMWAYVCGKATPDDCRWVLAWIAYYLAAPAFAASCARDPDTAQEYAALCQRVRTAPPEAGAIADLIWACLDLGLDPL